MTPPPAARLLKTRPGGGWEDYGDDLSDGAELVPVSWCNATGDGAVPPVCIRASDGHLTRRMLLGPRLGVAGADERAGIAVGCSASSSKLEDFIVWLVYNVPAPRWAGRWR